MSNSRRKKKQPKNKERKILSRKTNIKEGKYEQRNKKERYYQRRQTVGERRNNQRTKKKDIIKEDKYQIRQIWATVIERRNYPVFWRTTFISLAIVGGGISKMAVLSPKFINTTFLLRRICEYAIFVVKVYKKAINDSFQGSAGFHISSTY